MWLQIDELRLGESLPERCMAALYEATLGLSVRNASYAERQPIDATTLFDFGG
jgi:hypothetical protein